MKPGKKTDLTDTQIREISRLRSSGKRLKEVARIVGCTYYQAQYRWLCFISATYAEDKRRRGKSTSRVNAGLKKVFSNRKQRIDLTVEEQQAIAKKALAIEIDLAKRDIRRAAPYKPGPLEW